jgi:hypothetical protein
VLGFRCARCAAGGCSIEGAARAFNEAPCKQTVQIKAIVENASDDEQTWRRTG